MKAKNYPENWKDEIRPQILKRDNYTCKKCKIKHRSIGYYDYKKNFIECDDFMVKYAQERNFKLIKIILQVHHKNCNKMDSSNDNLITLCPKCHTKEDREYMRLKRLCTPAIFPKK